jgi:hypothetical protein
MTIAERRRAAEQAGADANGAQSDETKRVDV